MFTVVTILVICALIVTVISGIGKCPLWPAVLLLCVVELLKILPK